MCAFLHVQSVNTSSGNVDSFTHVSSAGRQEELVPCASEGNESGRSPFKAVVGVAAPIGQQSGPQGMQDSIVVTVGCGDDEDAGPHAAQQRWAQVRQGLWIQMLHHLHTCCRITPMQIPPRPCMVPSILIVGVSMTPQTLR